MIEILVKTVNQSFNQSIFSDKDGKLALSPKQKQRFDRWVRPEDFCDNPQMIYAISSFSIRQVSFRFVSFMHKCNASDKNYQSFSI